MTSRLKSIVYYMYNCGLYLRLSKDDKKNSEKDESGSITNQREFLVKYAEENNLYVAEIYIDDGYSGTTSNRKGLQKLLKDIELKKINTVIVKDLSRLFRDYIQTGYYLEKYFPEKNVRFIAVLDGIDTNKEQNDLTPFKALMVDWYAKDISRKIKQVKRDKIKKGDFIGPKAPFGYKKDSLNKNKLVICEEESLLVKRIFELALRGESTRRIATILTKEGIKSPGGKDFWHAETISKVLQNEVYIGNMVGGKAIKPSYKSKKVLKLKQEEWIINKNTHEGIIDLKTFEKVGELIAKRRSVKTKTLNYPLKGIVICADCKKAMGILPKKNIYYLRCRTYAKYTKLSLCTSHSIRADYVLEETKKFVKCFFNKYITKEELFGFVVINNDIKPLEEEKNKLRLQIKEIYKDKLNNLIDEEDFKVFYKEAKEKLNSLTLLIESKESLNIDKAKERLVMDFLDINIYEELILNEFVEKVEVNENKEVSVFFKTPL